MSSMRSASSSTSSSRRSNLATPCRMWSSRRPGRGDDDVDAALERALLRERADAAEHRHRSDTGVAAEADEVLVDLRGELARGRQHEGARGAGRRRRHQALQQRQHEGGGLAAAGHGAGEHVAAEQRRRHRLGLDGRRRGEAEVGNAAHQRGNETELRERGGYRGGNLSGHWVQERGSLLRTFSQESTVAAQRAASIDPAKLSSRENGRLAGEAAVRLVAPRVAIDLRSCRAAV